MRILVLCTGNSCRSQMAEAFLRHALGPEHEVMSAGTEPRPLDPRALFVMAELGHTLYGQYSKHVRDVIGHSFDLILTVCDHARERCQVISHLADRMHKDFDDPSRAIGTEQQIMTVYRKVRDEIRQFCTDFTKDLN